MSAWPDLPEWQQRTDMEVIEQVEQEAQLSRRPYRFRVFAVDCNFGAGGQSHRRPAKAFVERSTDTLPVRVVINPLCAYVDHSTVSKTCNAG